MNIVQPMRLQKNLSHQDVQPNYCLHSVRIQAAIDELWLWASPNLETKRQAPRRTLPLPYLCRLPPLDTTRSTTDQASYHQGCLLPLPRAECQRFLCWNPHTALYISRPCEAVICCLRRRVLGLEDPPWRRFRMFWRTFELEYKKDSSPVLKKSHDMILFLCLDGVMKQIPIATSIVICLVHLVSEVSNFTGEHALFLTTLGAMELRRVLNSSKSSSLCMRPSSFFISANVSSFASCSIVLVIWKC